MPDDSTLEEILRLRESPAKQELLRARLQRASALRNMPAHRSSTWGGQLAGSLGDVLRAIGSSIEEGRATDELGKETQNEAATRGRVLRRALGVEDASGSGGGEASYPPPQSSPEQSTGGNVPHYLARPEQPGLTGQLINSFTPSPSDRADAVLAAQRRNPGQLATMFATSGDPQLERIGALQLEQFRRQQERQQQVSDYERGRGDKLSDVASERTFQTREKALDRTSREKAAALEWLRERQGLTTRTTLEEEKKRKAATVPGMEIAEGAEPTAEDAKKVKASRAAAERMGRYVKELRELHGAKGTEYGGPVGNRMQQLTEQIRLEGKNIAELGALSGPDMAIMERLAAADPGGFTANVKGLFGVDNTQGALTGLEKWVGDTLEGNASAYGYRPKVNAGGASVDDALKAFGK